MKGSPHVSILIPAYHVEKTIAGIVHRIRSLYPGHEILVIDDGSSDRTADEAQKAGAFVLSHPFNRGYGAALKTGLRRARGEIVVFLDGDGEHHPEDIQRLLNAMEEAHMAVGARAILYRGPLKRWGKWILTQTAQIIVQKKIPDLNSGLRALRRPLALRFLSRLPDGFSLTTTLTLLMFRGGYRVCYLPIRVSPRVGESTVRPLDFFKTFFRILKVGIFTIRLPWTQKAEENA